MEFTIKKTKNPNMYKIIHHGTNIISLLPRNQKIELEEGGPLMTVRKAYLAQRKHIPEGYL